MRIGNRYLGVRAVILTPPVTTIVFVVAHLSSGREWSPEGVVSIVVVVLVLFAVVIDSVFSLRCPNCRKLLTAKETEKKKDNQYYACVSCGEKWYRDEPPPNTWD